MSSYSFPVMAIEPTVICLIGGHCIKTHVGVGAIMTLMTS